jgi:hypothetical protein
VFRLVVIGVSGSGKTTPARKIACKLDLPHIELDALYWEANWQAASRPVFRGRVQEATAGDAWVVDGNYSQSRDIVWSRATHLAWLDYGLATVMGRVLWRTVCRVFSRQELWNGNRESIRGILGRDSIVWYAFTSHRRQRGNYLTLLQSEEFKHLTIHRCSSPKEASALLQSMTPVGFH